MKERITRLTIFILILSFILSSHSLAYDSLDLDGEAAILVDEDFESVLYEKNSDKKLYPASTTKIMTAILTIENGNLNEKVLIDEEVVENTSGSHIALDYNEEVTRLDLLHALLIASGNDAALALAKSVSGSLDEFVDLMNKKAKDLGATNTHFANPHGLHNENHYSTARDLYVITKYAMSNELFREIVSMPEYKIAETNKKEERLIHNTNKFLRQVGTMKINDKLEPIKYDGIYGVKTGYTPEAGNCLVSFAHKENRNLYAIVLNSKDTQVYADTCKLLDHGFNDFNVDKIASKNQFIDNIYIDNGKLPFIPTVINEDIYYVVDNNQSNIETKTILKDDLKLPIHKGEIIGSVEYYDGSKLLARGNMVSTIDFEAKYSSFLDFIIARWYFFVLAIFLMFRLAIISINNKNKSKSENIKFVK